MAISLIAVLDGMVDKTPDQIAAALKPKRWIKGSDMTQTDYDYMREGTGAVRLTEYHPYSDTLWWRGGSGYHIQDWRLESIRTNLPDYYFIRFEDYVDGEFPPDPVDRSFG
jgi:hypothetical protein